MTSTELQAALAGSGHEYLSAAEQLDFITRAVNDTCHEELWPVRETQVTGVAEGASVVNLGPILGVYDAANNFRPLEESTRAELMDSVGDISAGGTPRYYFVGGGTTINTQPKSAGNLTVIHYALGGWTVGALAPSTGADTPKWPAAWHDAAILRARQFAYEETDELQEAANMERRWKARLEEMRETLMRDQRAGRTLIKRTSDLI